MVKQAGMGAEVEQRGERTEVEENKRSSIYSLSRNGKKSQR